MQFLSVLALGALAISTVSTVAASDVDVLQYALTLEHLENAFYSDMMQNFTKADFQKAGFDSSVYNTFSLIASDEATHVSTIQNIIKSAGGTPAEPCTYNFQTALANLTNAIATAAVLEETGVKAYAGASGLLTSASVPLAASIVTIEARHAAFLEKINGARITLGPFDTPIGQKSILAAAASFFADPTSCASIAPAVAAGVYPSITPKHTGAHSSNQTFGLSSTGGNATDCLFAFGDQSVTAPYTNGTCMLPNATGYVQVTAWLANSSTPYNATADAFGTPASNIIAGPYAVSINDSTTTPMMAVTEMTSGANRVQVATLFALISIAATFVVLL